MKHIVLKAIILSALLHLLIFNTFIITFSARPGAPKPLFIFLGGILQKQDLFGTTPVDKNFHSDLGNSSLNLASGSSTLKSAQIQKPSFQGQTRNQHKIVLKPSALTPSPDLGSDEMDKNALLKDLGIDPETPKRVPLRLNRP